MESKEQDEEKVLLTLTNIKYLVEGLDALLTTDLDGDKRATVIQLRNDLLSHINSIFSDYSWLLLKPADDSRSMDSSSFSYVIYVERPIEQEDSILLWPLFKADDLLLLLLSFTEILIDATAYTMSGKS